MPAPEERPLERLVRERADAHGPLGYAEVVDIALYHPDFGFYETGGGAGRGGADFLTSPEVGPLFGTVIAGALDRWWTELSRPDPFTVVEAGAGRGALARAVVAAVEDCKAALRYVAVERSSALRAQHPDGVTSAAALPDEPVIGVVLANELLDNLPFALLQRHVDGWAEVRVTERLIEVAVPVEAGPEVGLAPDAPVGNRIPVQRAAREWVEGARARLRAGRVVVVDYADTTASLAERPWTDWVRTYAGHRRGGHPLAGLGSQDVTCEVAVDQLPAPDADNSQADFLRAHGLDALADEARRAWHARAHIGDLRALTARSRVHEAEALVDPGGLGAFRVLEWVVDQGV